MLVLKVDVILKDQSTKMIDKYIEAEDPSNEKLCNNNIG